MKYKKTLLFLALVSMMLKGCGSEDSDVNTGNPMDLTVEVTVADDGSGEIEIVAEAMNATEYYFDLDDNETEPITNTTGLLSHTYTESGIYDLDIRAYGSSGSYKQKEKEVTVVYGDDEISTEDGYNTPLTYEGMTLVWQDEFDGNSLDSDSWTYEIGTGSNGWGNNELQYYTNGNTTVADGVLSIEAREESYEGSSYTSSRIVTKDKESFKYGRIDLRAVLPQGQGIWPAMWMLGSNFSSVGWPRCGEIDIMEMVGGHEDTSHGTVHWYDDDNGWKADYGGKYQLDDGIFADEYHVFSLIWDSSSITWYVDDIQFHAISITSPSLSEFQQEFFFIFNVAVGGDWPGNPDVETRFPQTMKVDFVRVFQENN